MARPSHSFLFDVSREVTVMTKYVVISSNQSRSYSFMAPICALTWAARTEFKPVVLLTQTREHWKEDAPSRVVVDMLDRLDIRKHYVSVVKDCYLTSTQAQTARHYVAALKSFDPGDYILTTDVDGLPVDREWQSKVDWGKACHMRNANAWQYRWYTTFGFGAYVSAWREFMKYEPCGEIAPVMEKDFDLDLTCEADSLLSWYYDEFCWNAKLKASKFYPGECQFIERNTCQDRIDRSRWPERFDNLTGIIDAHVLRPSYDATNWPKIRALLVALLSEQQVEVVDQYHKRFAEAVA